MIEVNKNTVVVFSCEELKKALEEDNLYEYIYFGKNIILDSGIAISSSKKDVVIDGTYNGVTYEFTDQKISGENEGIYVTDSKTSKVTVKNMKITGYNECGVIYVPNNNSYSNFEVQYLNVEYTGVKLSYNPAGLTKILHSVITIEKSSTESLEVADCNRLKIGGFTTIIHKSISNSGFSFHNASPSLEILPSSNVIFTSALRELFCGVTDLEFAVRNGAYFQVIANNGLSYQTNGTLDTVLDENSYFSLTKTGENISYATWYSYGNITVEKGASLYVINDYEKVTEENYNIYFAGKNISFVLNNPLKVLLYNTLANVIYFKEEVTYNFWFSRINLFTNSIDKLSSISKDNLPTYSWYKEGVLSNISGTFISLDTAVLTSNFKEELKELPSLDNFKIQDKKILSIGNAILTVAPVTDKDYVIKGKTESYASVLIEYDNVVESVVADEKGEFSYTATTLLKVGTCVTFTAKDYEDVIYYTKKVTVIFSGELKIESATNYFEFDLYAIKKEPVICPRLNALMIKVVDTRINSSPWKLYASIDHDLESKTGEVLENSLIFVNEKDEIEVLSKTPTLVYTGQSNEGTIKNTLVTFERKRGILLQVLEPLENNTNYYANIIWTIEE